MAPDHWALMEAAYGEPLVGIPDGPTLKSDPSLWERVWKGVRGEALAEWTRTTPGTRPPAWHRFDAPSLPRRRDGESEPTWLHRCRQLGPEELELIRKKSAALTAFNRDRDPGSSASGYIEPTPVETLVSDFNL